MNHEPFDPFAALDACHVGEWERLLTTTPELLDGQQTESQPVIRVWDEIPDVMSMAALRIEWVVEGIIPRGSVTLLAGEPGSYKTWLALALLRGVTTGEKFLERQCTALSVLYLDRENPLTVVRERLAMLGIESLGSAKIWGGWLRDMPPAIGDVRLLEIARERRPLVLFDSLIRFHRADENSATEMAEVMQHLRALANLGATVVVLHHKPKVEGAHYRGSSDIAGAVDTAFSISRDREAGILKLECFKSRFVEEFSMTLRPDLVGEGKFVVTEAPEAAAERNEVEELAQTILANPGLTKGDVVARSGVPKGRARALLEQFDGQSWRSTKGTHNSRRFFPLESPATTMPWLASTSAALDVCPLLIRLPAH
jgi:hypothetical protein